MAWFSTAFLAGILLIYSSSVLPAWWAGVAATMAAIGLGWRRWWLAAGLLAGAGWAIVQAHWVLTSSLPAELEGVDVTAVVRIVGLPRDEGHRLRFVAEVVDSPQPLPRRLLLSWYRDRPTLRPGESWRLTLRLKRPRSFASPGAFDYAGWLYRQGIGATGYVRRSAENRKLNDTLWSIGRWRQALAHRLDRVGADLEHLPLIQALALGLRQDIPRAQWDTLIRTGTNHLLAISGLHIGLVATLGWVAVRWAWRWIPRLCLWIPAQRAAALLGLLPAALYAALAGFAIPTQRALIMLAVAAFALLSWRRIRPWSVWGTALFLILIADPAAVLAPGFWLSFIAVGAILASVARGWRGWRLALAIQFVLLVALLPVTLASFGRASLIAPLANLIAVPLVSLAVVPLALTGVVLLPFSETLARVVLSVADRLLDLLMMGLGILAEWPHAALNLQPPAGWTVALAMFAVVLWLAPRGLPGRGLIPLLALPMMASAMERAGLPPGRFVVDVLDVGQGLSVVVRTRDHLLVYDTGARFSARSSAASAVVLPFLRQIGRDRIDVLVLSHGDNDHAGGESVLLRDARVVSRHVAEVAGVAGREACRAGMAWQWDGVRFEYLHPGGMAAGSDNDRSCVLSIDNGHHRVLLPGDIEAPVERRLLESNGAGLSATLLVAPHHGSLTSSSPAFVAAVRPRWVVFPVGHRNRYGFPHPQVVERYRKAGSRLLRTDRSGTVSFRFGTAAGDVTVSEYRDRARRWWW